MAFANLPPAKPKSTRLLPSRPSTSPLFSNHRKRIFLSVGIAGVNPHEGTTGTAAFGRFAIQAALEYELDSREIPANFLPTGQAGIGRRARAGQTTILSRFTAQRPSSLILLYGIWL